VYNGEQTCCFVIRFWWKHRRLWWKHVESITLQDHDIPSRTESGNSTEEWVAASCYRQHKNHCQCWLSWPFPGHLVLFVSHKPQLRPFLQDHPGEPVPEENFWTLWCKGRLTEAATPTIRLGATPSGLTSAHLHHPPIPHCLQAGCPSCRPTNTV